MRYTMFLQVLHVEEALATNVARDSVASGVDSLVTPERSVFKKRFIARPADVRLHSGMDWDMIF